MITTSNSSDRDHFSRRTLACRWPRSLALAGMVAAATGCLGDPNPLGAGAASGAPGDRQLDSPFEITSDPLERPRVRLNATKSRGVSVSKSKRSLVAMTDVGDGDPVTDPLPDHYQQPGKAFGREFTLDPLATEAIDVYTGRLRLQYTDLQWQGTGLSINVVRSYHNPSNQQALLDQPILPGRTATGIGWDIHFGRLHSTLPVGTLNCKKHAQKADKNPSVELPDGSRKLLFEADAGAPYDFISKDRWIARCIDGLHTIEGQEFNHGGLLVTSPGGTKYTFDWQGRVRGHDTHYVWSVTQIEDRNGNTLSLTYTDFRNPYTLLTAVEASDNRKVLFEYDGPLSGGPLSNTPLLTTIRTASGSRVWNYKYEETSDYGQYQLVEVEGPTALKWRYAYHRPVVGGTGGYSVREVINPYGGKTSYQYALVSIQPHRDLNTIKVQGVASKTSSGLGVQPGTWTYRLFSTTDSVMDFTEVTGPTTRVLYEHWGLRAVLEAIWAGQGASVQHPGLLRSKATYAVRSDQTYDSVEPLQIDRWDWGYLRVSDQQDPIKDASIAESFESAKQAILARKTTVRGGVAYNTANYNEDDYGNPRAIFEYKTADPPPPICWTPEDASCSGGSTCDICALGSSPDTRVAERSYYTNTDRWIINQRQDELLNEWCPPLSVEDSPSFCEDGWFLSGTVREFDDRGNLTQTHSNNQTDKTLMSYYETGELASKTDPLGNVVSYSNYHRGLPQTETHPLGVTISRVVDNDGSVTQETNARGKTTDYTHDALGRVTSISTPRVDDLDVVVDWRWGDTGTLATQTVSRGELQDVRTFDGFGRQISRSAANITLTTEYDAAGRTVFSSYPNSADGERYSYDGLGRLVEQKHPDDTTVSYNHQAGDVMVVTNERGHSTTYRYRALASPAARKLIEIQSPEGVTTSISRLESGAVYQIQQGGKPRLFMRDDRYRVRYEYHPETGAHEKSYDEAGNLIDTRVNQTRFGGSGAQSDWTHREYDALGRVSRIDYPGSTPDTTFDYDAAGNLLKLTRGDTEWTYTYGDNGKLSSETLTAAGRTFPLRYSYDRRDALSSMTYPSGLVVNYTPDVLGRPTTAGEFVKNVSYHPDGQVHQLTYGNDLVTTVELDGRLRLDAIKLPGIINLAYGYDPAGNVQTIVDGLDAQRSRSMSYDGLNRLVGANSGLWGEGTIAYNLRGDITSKAIGDHSVQYNYPNGQSKLASVEVDGELISLAYNYYGDVTRRGDAIYRYNDASNLVSFAPAADATPTTYAYDGRGRRVLKTSPEGQQSFSVYNTAGQLVYESGHCAAIRTEHVRLGRSRVAERRQACVPGTDTDFDQIPDCVELCAGLKPDDATDGGGDADEDGLSNLAEHQAGTDINKPDTDGDSLDDKQEVDAGSNPLEADTDHDGLDDAGEAEHGTDPWLPDSDGDGMLDAFEVGAGFNPLEDDAQGDADGDGISNYSESLYGDAGPPSSSSRTIWELPNELNSSQGGRLKIAPGGRIVDHFHRNAFRVLDWSGELVWQKSETVGSPVVTAGGLVVVGLDGPEAAVVAFSPLDGREIWRYLPGASAGEYCAVSQGPAGTLLMHRWNYRCKETHQIEAKTGKFQRKLYKYYITEGLVAPDGSRYVENHPGLLHYSATDQAVLWSYDPAVSYHASGVSIRSTSALGVDGTVYLVKSGSWSEPALCALNAQGRENWCSRLPPAELSADVQLVVATDGTIYVGGDGYIAAFRPDGSTEWVHELERWSYRGVGGTRTVVDLALAADGTLYYALWATVTGRSAVVALDPRTRTTLWAETINDSGSASSLTVAADGTVIVRVHQSSDYYTTIAIRGQPGGLAPSVCPVRGIDARGSYVVPPCPPLDGDGDGIPDCHESRAGLDLTADDRTVDADGDGLSNAKEYEIGTHHQSADSDGDGLADQLELESELDPRLADSDGDGMGDGFEREYFFDPKTNEAAHDDDDEDGYDNLKEHDLGSDPRDPRSVPAGHPLWSFLADKSSAVAPVMGDDGYIYFAGGDQVYRLIPEFPFSDPQLFYTADADVIWLMHGKGRLYVASGKSLAAVEGNGVVDWQHPETGELANAPGRAALGSDGTVYLPVHYPATGHSGGTPYSLLTALDAEGQELWATPTDQGPVDLGDPSIALDGTLYLVAAPDGPNAELLAIDPANGAPKWRAPISSDGASPAAPVIGDDGSLLIVARSDVLVEIRPTAEGYEREQAADPYPSLAHLDPTPVVAGADWAFFVEAHQLNRVRTVGPPSDWKHQVNTRGLAPQSIAPAVSSGGAIYVVATLANRRYGISAIDPAAGIASVRWRSRDLSSSPLSPPLLLPDGLLFVMGGRRLYVFADTAGGPAETWPLLGNDVGRTGNAANPSVPEINAPPELTLSSPTEGATASVGDKVRLSATATDDKDGDLSSAISWSSSIDGNLGSGASFDAVLGEGQHVITATVSDSGGKTASTEVSIKLVRPATSVYFDYVNYRVIEGDTLNLTARARGGSGPYEYQFETRSASNGYQPVTAQDWSSSNTFAWDSSGLSGTYIIYVYARVVGQSEAPVSNRRYLSVYPAHWATSLDYTMDPADYRHTAGTVVTVTAQAVGGIGPYEYEFRIRGQENGYATTTVQPWSTSNTYQWDTSQASGYQLIYIYARTPGQSRPLSRYRELRIYPQDRATAVTLSVDKASPQEAGTPVTFSAQATGRADGNYEYQFLLTKNPQRSARKETVRDWSTDPSWTWATASATGEFSVRVQARGAGTDQSDIYARQRFTINNSLAATRVRWTTSSLPPVNQGGTLVLRAQASGGSGDYEYEYRLRKPGSWTHQVVRPWAADNAWTWADIDKVGLHRVVVYARARGLEQTTVYAQRSVRVVPSDNATGVTLEYSGSSPELAAGAEIDFSAHAAGGTGVYEYEFRLLTYTPTREVTVVQPWSRDNTWSLDTTGLHGRALLLVYARCTGTTHAVATSSRYYNIFPQEAARSVTFIESPPRGIQAAGTPLTFTAQASGGSGDYEYMFRRWSALDGLHTVQDWSSNPTWTWTPTSAYTNYNFVYVSARAVGISQPAVSKSYYVRVQ